MGMWCTYLLQLSQLYNFLESADVAKQGSWDDSSYRSSYFDLVDEITTKTQAIQVVVAFYPLSIGMRFFPAFSGQPRLAVVTDTLSNAATDILHFSVVMSVVIMVYGFSAEMLFGREVEEFENFGRS